MNFRRQTGFVMLLVPALLLFESCRREEPLPTGKHQGKQTTPVNPSDIFPASFGAPMLPVDNPFTEEAMYLGRMLFYDPILSRDSTISCASCHRQDKAFAQPTKVSAGIFGIQGNRNASALYNMAWQRTLFWDGRHRRMRDLIFEPIQDHREMAMNIPLLDAKLKRTPRYKEWFARAYDAEPDVFHMSLAMEQFLLSIVSANSKFDRFFPRNINVFTPQEQDGFFFFNDTPDDTIRPATGADCFHCHGGIHAQTIDPSVGIVNNGLDEVLSDKGLGGITGRSFDLGKFKAPSLRNLSYTAPYMHDGRFATLEEVIDHYSEGIHFNSPNLSPLINHGNRHLNFTPAQKAALIAFLRTMDDSSLLSNPRYSNPFR